MTARCFRALFLVALLLPADQGIWADCLHDASALFKQGRDEFINGQYLLATHHFSTFTLLSCSTEEQERGRLRWAESLFELGETSEAIRVLGQIRDGSTASRPAHIVAAWYQPTLIASLPEADRMRFHSFEDKLGALPQVKKPWLAGTLSAIVPGAGQTYNGSYQSAAFAFALNALFLATTLELARNNLGATAVTSGVVFSVVYIGNIVGAVQMSRAINTNSQLDAREELKTQTFPELTF